VIEAMQARQGRQVLQDQPVLPARPERMGEMAFRLRRNFVSCAAGSMAGSRRLPCATPTKSW
jgi:hypothetical protein